jgi:hypothetical protein
MTSAAISASTSAVSRACTSWGWSAFCRKYVVTSSFVDARPSEVAGDMHLPSVMGANWTIHELRHNMAPEIWRHVPECGRVICLLSGRLRWRRV